MERESTNSQVAFENYGLVADVMLSLFMKSHSHQLGIDRSEEHTSELQSR